MRRILRDNGLSLVLVALFAASLIGQVAAGHLSHNQEQREHGQPELTLGNYLESPVFLEATMENWESEFLQMAVFVVFTAFLFQRGSSQSKDPDDDDAAVDREPDPTRPKVPGPVRRGGLVLSLYKNSLSLALLALFVLSFVLHAAGGAGAFNEEQSTHGLAARVTIWSYVTTSKFWFESLQNWQSEFLSIAIMGVLSIFLRQHGSAESKPVDAPHSQTGTEG
jgi:hypothetical protein